MSDQNQLLVSPVDRVKPADLKRVEFATTPQLNTSPVPAPGDPSRSLPGVNIIQHPTTEEDKTIIRTRGAFTATVLSYDAGTRDGTVVDASGARHLVANGLDDTDLFVGDSVVAVFEKGTSSAAYVLGRLSGGTRDVDSPWRGAPLPGYPNSGTEDPQVGLVNTQRDMPAVGTVFDPDGVLGFGKWATVGPSGPYYDYSVTPNRSQTTTAGVVVYSGETGNSVALPPLPLASPEIFQLVLHENRLFALVPARENTPDRAKGAVFIWSSSGWVEAEGGDNGDDPRRSPVEYLNHSRTTMVKADGSLFLAGWHATTVSGQVTGSVLVLRKWDGSRFAFWSSHEINDYAWNGAPAPLSVDRAWVVADSLMVSARWYLDTPRIFRVPLTQGATWSAVPGTLVRVYPTTSDPSGCSYALSGPYLNYTDRLGSYRRIQVWPSMGDDIVCSSVLALRESDVLVGGALPAPAVNPKGTGDAWVACVWRLNLKALTSNLVWTDTDHELVHDRTYGPPRGVAYLGPGPVRDRTQMVSFSCAEAGNPIIGTQHLHALTFGWGS